MGRHTRFLERASWEEAPSDAAPPVKRTRMAWLGRTPLMPILAGIIAVSVIAAAFSTRQISLNFAGVAPAEPGSAACAGCEPLSDRRGDPEARTQAPAEESPSQDAAPRQSARSASQQPLRVSIRLTEMISGGFTAVAVIRNTSKTDRNWRLAFRIPNAVVVDVEGATFKTTKAHGGTTWFAGLAPLPAHATVKVRFTANGAWSKPALCKINGKDCA
jgi:hypothetical protein